MFRRTLVIVGITSILVAAPARADPSYRIEETRSAALKWEVGYLTLSALDAAETIHCLDRGTCKEGNPIFGKHPSTKTLILAKIGLGAIHFAAFSALNARNPKSALRLAQVSCAVQGGVAMVNARFSFQ